MRDAIERAESAADEEAKGGVCKCCFKVSQMLGCLTFTASIFAVRGRDGEEKVKVRK
jgi:hypothetical protein